MGGVQFLNQLFQGVVASGLAGLQILNQFENLFFERFQFLPEFLILACGAGLDFLDQRQQFLLRVDQLLLQVLDQSVSRIPQRSQFFLQLQDFSLVNRKF